MSKINKTIKNRFNIMYIIVVCIVLALVFNLAKLTIVDGDKYREETDVKIVKAIPVKAPRGVIYDRNGEVLADNLTSFTVQLYKDKIESKELNNIAYKLSEILSENGETFIDDFPIIIDSIEFKNSETDESGSSPIEFALSKLLEADNMKLWLDSTYYRDGKDYDLKKMVYYYFLHKKTDSIIGYENGIFIFSIEGNELKKVLVEEGLNEDITAEEYIISVFSDGSNFLENFFSDSRARYSLYTYLSKNNITDELKLNDFCFIQDKNYSDLKKYLSDTYEGITVETDAKNSFLYLVKHEALDNLFTNYYIVGEKNIIPAQIFLDKVSESYSDLPFDVSLKDGSLKFMYNGSGTKDKYLEMFILTEDSSAYDIFKAIVMKESEVLDDVLTSDELKVYAQTELLNVGINPLISVSTWEYTYLKEKRYWVESNLSGETDLYAEDVFNNLIVKMELNTEEYENLSNFELRNIMIISDRYAANSYLSYHPVDIAYNVLDKTVAMISETSYDLKGINIEIEPVRYYPNDDSAAHILGYLGKISSEYEINNYINENGYSGEDIIGKMGIEEKFESYLHGEKGSKTVTVNANGSAVKSVSEKDPVPGDNLYTTLDENLQKKVEEALDKGLKCIQTGSTYTSEWGSYPIKDAYKNAKSGAMVVLDCNNGEVLALANYPAYDLNLFSSGISTENWNSLLNDSKDQIAPRPLYNIAMLSAIQPGSTFKMVTALAALQKGVNPLDTIYCTGYVMVGNRKFGCWIYNMFGGAHGNQNLYQAIKNSCNMYFFISMLGENTETGQKHTINLDFEDVTDMACKLGLDDKTGIEIDIPSESYGTVPSVDGKKSTMKLYLSWYLYDKLKYYVKSDYDMSEVELSDAIIKICSWLDSEDIMTRNQVAAGLEDLNFDPYMMHDSYTPIVDIIKYTYINESIWNTGDSLNLAIGQGDNAYTPLQMANYVATIANGGTLHNVSVINKAVSYDGKITYEGERNSEEIDLDDYAYLDDVKYGMRLVALDSYVFKDFPIEVCVKTGTAEKDGLNPETKEPYDNYAWYVALAPYDNPEIAVVCLVFQGGSGLYPQAMVRDVIAEYFVEKGELERPQDEETDLSEINE